MRNESTLFYAVSQVKVLNEIYWQKGPVTFKLCKSLENSTGHGPGGQHYCRTLPMVRSFSRQNHLQVNPFLPSCSHYRRMATDWARFSCQLTCQSADIMSSLCGMGVRVRIRVNNLFSKTTRPRDVLFFLKDTLSIEDEKLFKACKSVCSSVC